MCGNVVSFGDFTDKNTKLQYILFNTEVKFSCFICTVVREDPSTHCPKCFWVSTTFRQPMISKHIIISILKTGSLDNAIREFPLA